MPQKNHQTRLQKIVAEATSLSRRAAEVAIREGNVSINGKVVTKMGTKADPRHDKICLKGRPIKPIVEKFYVIFNKPHNTIVSKNDPEGRPLIWDRLPSWMKDTLNSAGRLDFDTEGLIILTNDGDMINRLSHPSGEIWKTYLIKVRDVPDESVITRLKNGVKLEDGVTLPARVVVTRQVGNHTWLEIAIREGRNRQVRRMCAAVGHPVLKLRRIAIGPIKLGNLKPGQWKPMNSTFIC